MNLTDANIVPWLIPIPPLLAFLIIVLFTNRSRTVTHVVAIGGIVVSWLLSMGAVLNAVQFKALGLFGLFEMLLFLVILIVGFIWIWGKGALEWI